MNHEKYQPRYLAQEINWIREHKTKHANDNRYAPPCNLCIEDIQTTNSKIILQIFLSMLYIILHRRPIDPRNELIHIRKKIDICINTYREEKHLEMAGNTDIVKSITKDGKEIQTGHPNEPNMTAL